MLDVVLYATTACPLEDLQLKELRLRLAAAICRAKVARKLGIVSWGSSFD